MVSLIVRGAGDVGSAVAYRLRKAGYAVVLHDEPSPAHARRGMAFTDAFFDKVATLEGVLAKRTTGAERLARMLACGNALPVTDDAFERVLDAIKPDGIVDARMRKHDVPGDQRALASVVVGLGPGFVVGANAHVVVETAWGEELGKVVNAGGARDLAGEPRPVGGHGRDRFVHARACGILDTAHAIGDVVRAGEEVARVGDEPVLAPLDGILRGLTHDGAFVSTGTKIVEVDARGIPLAAFGIGERPGKIAAGVVTAIAIALRDH
jgi:xanthine dehydrogenase accessory factor